jgi:hypothetical protein
MAAQAHPLPGRLDLRRQFVPLSQRWLSDGLGSIAQANTWTGAIALATAAPGGELEASHDSAYDQPRRCQP